MASLMDLYRKEPTSPQGLLQGGYSPNPDIVDRASLLPIGQYEDGRVTLAWPGFIKDAYEGAVRSYEQGRQLPRADESGYYAGTPRAEPLDAFNAASIAPMAGVAGRAAGLTNGQTVVKPARAPGMKLLADEPDLSLPSLAPFEGRRLAYDIANGAGDDAGRVEMTLGPDGQAYIEHVVFGDSISNGTKGAREFLRLLKEQHPEVRSIFGDRVSGAHAASGQTRQAVDASRLFANDSNASLPSLLANAMDNPLPMDQASRMARAREMGFDTSRVLFHGSGRAFNAFDVAAEKATRGGLNDKGVFLSPDASVANRYAEDFGSSSPAVYPVHVRGKPLDLSAYEYAAMQDFEESLKRGEPLYATAEFGRKLADRGIAWSPQDGSPADAIRAHGFDYVQNEPAKYGHVEREVMVFDPKNIRSVNAAFDPAYSGSANLLAANDSNAALPSLLANALEQPKGIRAYHGSPHDFDQFDMSKIGTGEGNQAYGHGLYFAENEGVAKWYRDVLGGPPSEGYAKLLDNINASSLSDQAKKIAQDEIGFAQRSGGLDGLKTGAASRLQSVEGRLAAAQENAKSFPAVADPNLWAEWGAHADFLRWLKDAELPEVKPPNKRMYEVNIKANPEQFLDWDTLPLPERNKLMSPEGMSNMREAGIPGVRYLDGGSRSAGEGSYNYVVNDASLIEILRKYGLLGTAGLGAGLLGDDGEANATGLLGR
jgi:hypothetical protein